MAVQEQNRRAMRLDADMADAGAWAAEGREGFTVQGQQERQLQLVRRPACAAPVLSPLPTLSSCPPASVPAEGLVPLDEDLGDDDDYAGGWCVCRGVECTARYYVGGWVGGFWMGWRWCSQHPDPLTLLPSVLVLPCSQEGQGAEARPQRLPAR